MQPSLRMKAHSFHLFSGKTMLYAFKERSADTLVYGQRFKAPNVKEVNKAISLCMNGLGRGYATHGTCVKIDMQSRLSDTGVKSQKQDISIFLMRKEITNKSQSMA